MLAGHGLKAFGIDEGFFSVRRAVYLSVFQSHGAPCGLDIDVVSNCSSDGDMKYVDIMACP